MPINAKKNFDVASYEALLLKFTCWVGARQCRRNKQTPSQTQGAKERQLETTELKLEALQKRKTMGGVRGGDKRGCVSLIQMTRACILCYFYNANISD